MTELTIEQMQERIDQIERESAGGRGFVGLIHYSFGYKVFAADFSNEETWFPFGFAEGEQQEAMTKARVFIRENNTLDNQDKTAQPQTSICFRVPLATLLSGGDNWKVDQYFVTPLYYDSYKMVLKPAITELNIWPGQFWARFGWVAEPTGRTKKNQEGDTVAVLVACPMDVYASEVEAQAAAGQGTTSFEAPDWLEKMVGEMKVDVGKLALPALRAKYALEMPKEEGDYDAATELTSGNIGRMAAAIAKMTSESAAVISSLL